VFYVYTPEGAEPTYPFTLTDLRRLHPNISWPAEIDAATAEEFGCYAVTPTDAPVVTGKRAERTFPVLVNGQWVEQWVLVDYSADEIEQQWSGIRAERNTLLSSCDWWVTKAAETNATISVEQHAYRQALRDITQQADPFNIIWPIEPIA
jgi:hypothetical protein